MEGNNASESIQELPFNTLLNKIQNEMPSIGQEVARFVYNQVSLILNDDNTDLFRLFEEELKPLITPKVIDADDETQYLNKSSLLGMYHRKLMICYNHSSFSTINKFLKNIQKYHDDGISAMNLSESSKKSSNNNKENILNSLKYPYCLDRAMYALSKHNNNRMHQQKDAKLFEIISDSFPDLASTHYLNMIENMKNGEYIQSLSYLHKYFDFVASSFKMNWSSIINNKSKKNKLNQKQYQLLLQQKRKKMQYSLLCRAMFYAYFGHYNLAIQVKHECNHTGTHTHNLHKCK